MATDRSLDLGRAPVRDLDPLLWHDICKLRADVFVVEQECIYPDLDGRDVEPGAQMVWGTRGGEVVATARILRENDAIRIGRVATAPSVRGTGIAQALFCFTLEQCEELAPQAPVVLNAQAPLEGWYARFGFRRDGDDHDEDGIPHIPMRRG